MVAGLLIEYGPELPEEWRKFRDEGGWKAVRSNKDIRKPLAILVGAILVTVGVTGEMVFEKLSFHKEGQLEEAHGQLDRFLQGKAQDAATSAQKAKDDAAAVHVLAQSASDIARLAKERAEEVKGEADTVSREADRLGRQLTTTGNQLNAIAEKGARLVEELGWREITQKQHDAIVSVLPSSPGSRVIIGITSPDSAEKRQYAWVMLSVFNDAKWSFAGFRDGGLEFDGRIPIGISIWCGGQSCESSSAALHNALCAAGIMSVPVFLPQFGPDTILVIGDVRPPKFQDMERLSLECKTPWPIPAQNP